MVIMSATVRRARITGVCAASCVELIVAEVTRSAVRSRCGRADAHAAMPLSAPAANPGERRFAPAHRFQRDAPNAALFQRLPEQAFNCGSRGETERNVWPRGSAESQRVGACRRHVTRSDAENAE